MASRRMFNISLLNADDFFELDSSAKILYFYLALNADDDGFISGLTAYKDLSGVRRMTLRR
ncbi:MAG: hypothetical protein IJM75_04545 [Ruminococcus sp.]|nr:hypothetical protein [Ruminococcus sp.]